MMLKSVRTCQANASLVEIGEKCSALYMDSFKYVNVHVSINSFWKETRFRDKAEKIRQISCQVRILFSEIAPFTTGRARKDVDTEGKVRLSVLTFNTYCSRPIVFKVEVRFASRIFKVKVQEKIRASHSVTSYVERKITG